MRSRSILLCPVKKSIWCPASKRQRVARRLDRHVLEHPAGGVPTALDQMAECCDVPPLAGIGGQRGGGGEAFARHRQAGGLGAEQVQPGPQNMGHGEVGAERERRIRARHRVIPVALQIGERRLELREARLIRAAEREAEAIGRHSINS